MPQYQFPSVKFRAFANRLPKAECTALVHLITDIERELDLYWAQTRESHARADLLQLEVEEKSSEQYKKAKEFTTKLWLEFRATQRELLGMRKEREQLNNELVELRKKVQLASEEASSETPRVGRKAGGLKVPIKEMQKEKESTVSRQ